MNDLIKYKELCGIWTQQWLQYETDEIYQQGRINGTIQNKAKGLNELFQKLQSENKDFLLSRITDNKSNQSVDELCFIIDHIRSEGIINYQTPTNLEELIEIGLSLCENKLQTNKYLEAGYIIDTILDTYWHQTNKDNVSKEIIQKYAKLCSKILDDSYSNQWDKNHYFKHCIYFILMSDYRFNDNEFLTLNRKLKEYIKSYGEDHHLSQRWIKRSNEIEKRTK